MPGVIIIGGGISGLSAAYELASRRVPFVLLEASDRTGGLVRTDHVDGFTIDSGADSMLATKPAAVRLCEELGLGPRLMSTTPPRTAFVHADGRLHALPSPSVFGIPTTPAGVAGYSLLPPDARDHLARLMEASEAAAQPDDESVADFYRRHFGPATVSLVAEPLLGGIHAGDVEKLSVSAVTPRLVAAAAEGRLFHAPAVPARRPARDSSRHCAAAWVSSSRRSRAGCLTEACGGEPLRRLSRSPVRHGRSRRDSGTFAARAIIMAAPAHAAARLLASADAPLAALCAEVPYVSTVSVALAWPRASVDHPLAGSGFVVARQHSRLRITACTWVSSKWQERARPDMVLLRAFLGGALDPGACRSPG